MTVPKNEFRHHKNLSHSRPKRRQKEYFFCTFCAILDVVNTKKPIPLHAVRNLPFKKKLVKRTNFRP